MSWGTGSLKKDSDGAPGLSKATQELLNDAMKSRGLSIRAMQDVQDSMRRGDGAWADHLSTSTASFKAPASKAKATVKVPKFSGSTAMPLPMPPASFSGKRMDIGKAERDVYAGAAPGTNWEKEKDRLSKVMELGAKKAREQELEKERMAQEVSARVTKPVDARDQLIDQVVDEIRERREFLEAMQQAGKGAEHEARVKTEIAIRLKELERLGLDVKASRPAVGTDPSKLRLG